MSDKPPVNVMTVTTPSQWGIWGPFIIVFVLLAMVFAGYSLVASPKPKVGCSCKTECNCTKNGEVCGCLTDGETIPEKNVHTEFDVPWGVPRQ